MSREPAVIAGLVASLAAALVEILGAADTGNGISWQTVVVVGLPLLAGILTRFNVVPVETIRTVISGSRSATAAVADLANRVDVAVTDPGR